MNYSTFAYRMGHVGALAGIGLFAAEAGDMTLATPTDAKGIFLTGIVLMVAGLLATYAYAQWVAYRTEAGA